MPDTRPNVLIFHVDNLGYGEFWVLWRWHLARRGYQADR